MPIDLDQLLEPISDLPIHFDVDHRILRSSLNFPPDRFLVMVVGRLMGVWTSQGPYMGRTYDEAREEALAAATDFTDVRLIGPVRVDDLRRILFGGGPPEPC
jgi:hypothetical protein